jgi:predicted HicB family RNase H-like nuclease
MSKLRGKNKVTRELKIMSVRLTPALITRVKVRAAQQHVSMEEWVSRALETALKQRFEGDRDGN